jgi:hypothetical protein
VTGDGGTGVLLLACRGVARREEGGAGGPGGIASTDC